ncbi:MAG: hypothetical protein OQK50_02995 [Deltaproteobacteria bacterium]|jgi:hypothetical protein|nr:hypothetical protein [Deltaproteobacteria bacterium]
MVAFLFIIIIFMIAVAFCLHLARPRSMVKHNEKKLSETLTRLLQKPRGSHIIIEEPSSGKYLQVSGSIMEPIVFDLPCQALTLDEYDRAHRLFTTSGYDGPETFAIYESYTGRPSGTQTSFLLTWGRENITQLQQLILLVFSQVYRVDTRVVLNIVEQ